MKDKKPLTEARKKIEEKMEQFKVHGWYPHYLMIWLAIVSGCCVVLCCDVLCYALLCCVVLCCAVLCCVVLCVVLRCVGLGWVASCCAVLRCVVLSCLALCTLVMVDHIFFSETGLRERDEDEGVL